MNIVRRLLSSSGGSIEGGDAEPDGNALSGKGSTIKTPEQELLGLNHLKKLHAEYINSPLAVQEKEEKLYAMLPLFCNVFASVGPKVISDRFGDEVNAFTVSATRLLVTEVRRLASNQSTEAAAGAIATFMEIDASGGGNGWHLLSTLSLLVAEGDDLAEIMTNAALPSTLVKCLYLFFDLPVLQSSDVQDSTTDAQQDHDEGATSSHTTPKERRLLLQKMFIQVLLKLCTYQPAVEELARKDDLTLLFSAVTSECPAHNVMWRKTAADILLTISRHSLSQPVISYLHGKGCLSLCVENMQKNTNVTHLETVEMFVTVFCFLKDSSQNSETLLEDFRTCQGYIFLSEFLLSIDSTTDEESREALRNLVLLVSHLSFYGHAELKMPGSIGSNTLYQLESFEQPEPLNRGSTVRNLLAFQVLQSAFLKSKSEYLDSIILDAISTIYSADNANYFLSENLSFLPQCAEKISFKAQVVQEKFFHLIEFLVHQLKYVPCKELIAVSLILKAQSNQGCCQLAVKSLLTMIKFDSVFKNVFREVGMLEALIGCLTSYTSDQMEGEAKNREFGHLIIAALSELISGNPENARVYRDSGGVSAILVLAGIPTCRDTAISLLQHLVLASGSEQDMTLLLELIQSAKDYEARQSYINAVISCLRDSHRCRATFRRCGGFGYLVSVLLSLNQCLSFDKELEDIGLALSQLRSVFNGLAVSMRFEPANARYFQMEICSGNSLLEAIQLIGCFSPDTAIVSSQMSQKTPSEPLVDLFRQAFVSDLSLVLQHWQSTKTIHTDLNPRLFFACVVLRMIYDMATDGYEKTTTVNSAGISTSSSRSSESDDKLDSPRDSSLGRRKPAVPSLNLLPPPPEPVIVHPSLVNVMLQLLPTLRNGDQETVDDYTVALQTFIAEAIQSLLRSEKNQQLMCDVGFLTKALVICKAPLEDDNHALHSPFQYLLERLAGQKLEPSDLRTFLRLGNPLACLSHEERSPERNANGESKLIPLTRIKTIVSMTTPRDVQLQNNCILPPFIEFDMTPEGFGCLFLPSIAPTSAHSVSVVGVSSLAAQESNVIGGIGIGDRSFPSQPGLSFSTWICVDKFSDPRTDPHPVRLLTIARTVKENGKEETYVCLAIALSARDKALIVSTNEVPLSKSCDWQPDYTPDHGARVWFPDLIKESEWHHLVVVLNRQVLKNSSFSLFVNGQHIATQKVLFISPTPGGGGGISSGNIAMATSIFGYIGTPPHWRRQSRLCWKQGPCLLLEDVVSPQLAAVMYRLGPHYLGSLQAPQIAATGEVLTSQMAEEKIVFGLNAVAVTQLTLAKIKKIYSKVDNKAIARHLGMGTGENATPITILHNSAGHLLGPARSLGGVVIGYLGARVFSPQPVSKVMETVGGCHVMLGLIATAHTMESLYAGVKALVCVIKSNPFSRMQMEENKGYQTLAMLLRKKAHLLNAHILHLMFTMAGTLDTAGSKETVGIPNVSAFRDVLCDLDLWHAAPAELEKSLFEHFYELICDSSVKRSKENIKLLREFGIVDKLLANMKSVASHVASTTTLLKVIHGLLCTNPRVSDVLCFALFTASTLDICDNEKELKLQLNSDGTQVDQKEPEDPVANTIVMRNRCLKLFHSLLYMDPEDQVDGEVHVNYCEDVAQVVGFDFVLAFLRGQLHPTTTVWGLKILLTLLSLPMLMAKFRTGTCNGHWLIKSENVLRNKMIEALGQGSSTSSKVTRSNIRHDIFQVPGFQHLNWLMPHHTNIPEVYFLLSAILVGKVPAKDLPIKIERIDLDSIWMFIFGSRASEVSNETEISICGDAMVTILVMVRSLLNQQVDNALPDWLEDYPMMLTQFLFYLYRNVPEFASAFMTSDVLTSLVGTLFPSIQTDSCRSSPDTEPESTSKSESTLSAHPAKKNVINFMRVLIVDSLSLLSSPKNPPVVDLLLDAEPPNTSQDQRSCFQTELLAVIMDHLLAADVLIGDQAALPIANGGHAQYIVPNVFYLASRLVDKLWQGIFQQTPDDVFQFILKLIAQVKRRSGGGSVSLEGIYRSLNRTILYMLSRPHSNVAGQMSVLEVLHKIVDNRGIIFGAGNHELDFFASLTFCLLRLSAGKNIPLEAEGKTTWHISNLDIAPGEPANLHQGQNLLVNAATRVWDLMYVSKKPALEEVFKISFGQQNSTPPLESARENVYEAASKIWFSYIDQEKKGLFAKVPPWEFHSQLQSRLQRVTGGFAGGLRRLTSVGSVTQGASASNVGSGGDAKAKREELVQVEPSNIPVVCFLQATANHISIVKEVVEHHFRTRQQTDQHMLSYVEEEWRITESMLTRERGIWGPYNETPLTKWMLDMTEGPSRMRRRLIRNDDFYLNYPYQRRRRRTTAEDGPADRPLKYKRPTSRDSQSWYEQHQPAALLDSLKTLDDRIVEEYDDCDISVAAPHQEITSIDEEMRKIGFKTLTRHNKPDNEDEADEENEENSSLSDSPLAPQSPTNTSSVECEESSSDYQTVMRLLEPGEKISHMYRCARIQGLDTTEGLLLFGKEHFYVLDGFTLVNGREVHDINFIPTTYYEPIIPQVPGQTRPSRKRQVKKYAYDGVKEVHKRRYLLQGIAVEVFCADGQNQLLAFMKDVRPKVIQTFLSVSTSIADNAQTSVAGQRLSASVEQSGGLFSSLMGETSVTQRWVRGEITNFQYLMALNTLAGRSYNDLMQYPIFPWILADYASQEEPDFNDPATFRDLSKPMGAQTSQRLEQFKKRFNDWDDPHGDTPPYHYGTHYSSAMIVSSFLVRMEPFTQHFLHLQGGHFDLADRMFHSIDEAWQSASKNNMADVRELIPEFFYLPDFLENRNHFDIGTKQNGEALDDVILPAWAKKSAAEFIRVHRAALESDYVSKHLHEWIDLIFGYKQQGPAAVEAVNVFHHLFYEGNVDIFSIEDPLKRNATIGFINNFGQTPKQLFRKPHPAKRVVASTSSEVDSASAEGSSPAFHSKLFFHNLTNLRPTVAPIKELKGPVGQIQQTDNRVVLAVEQNKVLVPGMSNSNRYLAWGYADQSFRLGNYDSDKAVFICEPSYLIGQVLTCVCPNAKEVITAGTSSVVMVYDYNKKVKQLMIKKLLYGHTDAVICLAASQAWSIAVSGSRDRSAIIWDLSRYTYVKHLPGHAGPVATVAVNDMTGDIVTCAGSWLYVWDIGGRPLASIDTNSVCPPLSPQPKQQQILCVACSQMNEWDRENVIMTGSSDGVVRMWSVDLVEEPALASAEEGYVVVEKENQIKNDGYTWRRQLVFRAKLTMHTAFERSDNVEPAAVTALAVSRDHRTIYVGDDRGRVFSWSVASKPGKGMVDHWMKDEGVGACVDCGVKFTFYERRHHCRHCGKVFCSSCSQYQAEIPRLKIMQPVRVCKSCHDSLTAASEETSPKKK